MTPEVLQTITSAKSVGIPQAGPIMQSDLALMLKAERSSTAKGKQSQVMRAPQWTTAECAQACQGLDQRYFYAVRYVWARDEACYGFLRTWLYDWALEQRPMRGWPKKVYSYYGPTIFMQALVETVLTEYIHGGRVPFRIDFCLSRDAGLHFLTPKHAVRAFVGITEATWKRSVAPVYEQVYSEFRTWEQIGTGWMRNWLRDPGEVA